MSIDSIGAITETLQTNIRTEVKKDHVAQTQARAISEKTLVEKAADVVDLITISYPPLLPVGDTQSIYKIKK
jgi:hypothetical protein